MISKSDLSVIQLFPYSARISGGHTNAIRAFIESQRRHGINVQGLSPLCDDIPDELRAPLENLPIRELDFNAPDFCVKATELATVGRTVFHFTGFTRPFFRLGKRLERLKIPYIFASQGQLHFHGPANWLKKFVYLNLVNPFVRHASGLHFTTRNEATRCNYLLPGWRKPVFIQNNLVEVPAPANVTAFPRGKFNLPEGAFVFAYMGRLNVAQKGLDCLIKAFAKITDRKDSYLALIGPDYAGGRQFLERIAERLHCADRIRFLGAQYGEKKWQALKLADAFVSPSRWEGFSSAHAEAIGFGLPSLISTKVNYASDMTSDRAALAEPVSPDALAGAMRRLMNDAALRRELSENGRKWVHRNCSIESAGPRFEEFYRILVA